MIKQLLPIARAAGDAIMSVYAGGAANVQQKDDASPVSEAGLAAHRVLAYQLMPLLPGCSVVSGEDSASQVYRQDKGRFWLIDPLDGTKEFIARSGEFTATIALIEDGRSVLGVVGVCACNRCAVLGGAGLGTWRFVRGETAAIKVFSANPSAACRVVASKSHIDKATQLFIDRLGAVSLVQAGSSLKFCGGAEGDADIYPRLAPTCEWGAAAAQAVLEGAGGAVLDLHGQPLQYGKSDVLNPSFIATRDTAIISV